MRTGDDMKWFFLAVAIAAMGCTTIDIENGDGNVSMNECTAESSTPLYDTDPPGVVATCDDHIHCTVDVQCTPCSMVPERIRYVKATCTPDGQLSPFCFVGDDVATRVLTYTGCTHFAADQGIPCFPVQYQDDPDEEVHSGICNAIGICVDP